MSFSYSFPGNSDCLLANEDDFVNMGFMIQKFSIDLIEVDVKQSVGLDVTDSSSSIAISGLSSDIEGSTSCGIDVSTSFFRHEEKQLKSAKWATDIDKIGQVFEGGISQFRNTLCKHATTVGFDFVYVKNDKLRLTAKCVDSETRGCRWRIHASIESANGFAYIRTYEKNHSCGDVYVNGITKKMSDDVVSSIIIDDVRSKPSTGASEVLRILKEDYGVYVSYRVAWLAVEKARDVVFGEADLAYDKLRSYFDNMKQLDPSSHFALDYDMQSRHFKRCFVSFGASLYGFDSCRPILFIDGAHLRGKYKGVLLSATAKDGNNGLFNIAHAVVASEDIDNWTWFLEQLEPFIRGRRITFISDRHPGIISAVKNIMPQCFHSFCICHLRNNLRDKMRGFSGELRRKMIYKLCQCASARTKEIFHTILDEMRHEGGDKVCDLIDNLPHENYANAYFKGRRYGEMTSNAAESFNSQFKDARALPVSELIDQIRLKLMSQMASRRADSLNWSSSLCPTQEKRYINNVEKGHNWIIHSSSESVFEVKSSPSMVVNIDEFTCTCGKWQHEGFSCVHATAVLARCNKDAFKYIDKYFHTSSYRSCYEVPIQPHVSFGGELSVVAADEGTVILPPLSKRPPGRPKKNRFTSRGEVVFKRKMKCGRCGRVGNHKKKTCKVALEQ